MAKSDPSLKGFPDPRNRARPPIEAKRPVGLAHHGAFAKVGNKDARRRGGHLRMCLTPIARSADDRARALNGARGHILPQEGSVAPPPDGQRFPVFVLSLPGDDARRAPLERWLQAQNLPFEVVFGVDGRAGLPPDCEPLIDRARARQTLGRAMGDGEFACALSHQKIYQCILDRDLPGAVILEDDARPRPPFLEFYRAQGYLAAPMILLDHRNTRVRLWERPRHVGGVDLYRLSLPPFCAAAYSLTAAAARQMRDNAFPISRPADWPCDITQFEAVAAMPRPVIHTEEIGRASHLSRERVRQDRRSRFLHPWYWKRWVRKRMSRRLSERV